MPKLYMSIEIYPDAATFQFGVPSHNLIATHEEMAEYMKDYRGHVHVITGFFTEDQVKDMSYTDRGLAHLDEESVNDPASEGGELDCITDAVEDAVRGFFDQCDDWLRVSTNQIQASLNESGLHLITVTKVGEYPKPVWEGVPSLRADRAARVAQSLVQTAGAAKPPITNSRLEDAREKLDCIIKQFEYLSPSNLKQRLEHIQSLLG